MSIHQRLLKLRQQEKQITSEILEVLQLMEDKRGYLKVGYSSLYDYLVRGLGYSESTAYQRQSCLRLCRDIPEIKQKIDDGVLSFSAITMVYKTAKNKSLEEKKKLIASIENKSSREVKEMFMEPAREIKVKKQVYQDKVHIRLELSHDQYDKLQRLKSLKSHKHDFESLFEALIDKELKQFESTSFKGSKSTNDRYIPRRLRNHVLKSAGYKCQYAGCESKDYLQIDHIRPVRFGGKPERSNLQVLCSAHNRLKG